MDVVIYVGMFGRDISGIINKIGKPLVIAYSTTGDSHACSVTYDWGDIFEQIETASAEKRNN